MIPTKCNSCGKSMLVSQAAWMDPFAHVCVDCMSVYTSNTEDIFDDEFDDDFLSPDDESLQELAEAWADAMQGGRSNKRTTEVLDEFDDEEIIDNEFEFLDDAPVSCECGAEKANTPHARWCPLYSNPMTGETE